MKYGEDEAEDEDEEKDRVLVFGTARNIDLLCQSEVWFLDGTFKTSSNLFVQIFTIMGLRRRNDGEPVALPFVYAYLTRKTEAQYTEVLQAVRDIVVEYNIGGPCLPVRIMSDFEKGILNAAETVFPQANISCCFFHLCQSIYRRVQDEGLQCEYNDPENRQLKKKMVFYYQFLIYQIQYSLGQILPSKMK